ncbi:MAG: hypothetical protein WBD36_10660 [Bacteroidota bacterium]
MTARTIMRQVLVGGVMLLAGVTSADAQISVTGGNIVTNITTALPGQEPTAVTNTVTQLSFKRQAAISKITVRTSCPSQRFNLRVVATAATDGVAAPAVTLTNGMLDTDFLTSIPAKPPGTAKTCTLQYTASSAFAQGNSAELGNDVHTVTYTILVQ